MTIKLLDTEFLIGFFKDLQEPSIFEILANCYSIAIPSRVYGELIDTISFNSCKKLIEEGKMEILKGINEEDFIQLKNHYPELGNGELELMIWHNYLKEKGEKCHCILNDNIAREKAKEIGINNSTTKELLYHLRDKKMIEDEKIDSIILKSKKTRYLIE